MTRRSDSRVGLPLFTGVTWKGLALVALLCVINAVRRTIMGDAGQLRFSDGPAFVAWLWRTLEASGFGLIVALPVVAAVVVTVNLVPRRAIVRYSALSVVVFVASIVGVWVSMLVEAGVVCQDTLQACFGLPPPSAVFVVWTRYLPLCALFSVVFVYLRVADESATHAQQAERDRTVFLQRMEEARLRMLQAQIEPHFLFNTLANVRRLYQTAPADAASMLDNLMRYFAIALPQMRATDSTLGREAVLTESYLSIQKLRMGRRLTFEIDIGEALRDARLPPMMLVTLAENAIKHGLAPLREGGTVLVTASRKGSELEVRVADSGRGFAQSSGGGTGLANIRARLSAMFGDAGRLSLSINTPRGVVATLVVPLSTPVKAR